MSLNEQQQKLVDKINGMVVSDAGPGTGKTHTIVQRYLNMIFGSENRKKIDPKDILMITFTNNGAKEMSDRIKAKIYEKASDSKLSDDERTEIKKMVKHVKTSTFDSLCYKIVIGSPDKVSDFFGIKETLSRNANLIENDTLNRQFFRKFYLEFISDEKHAAKYATGSGNPVAAIGDKISDLYKLVSMLMCRGIVPLYKGWFKNGEKLITGDAELLEKQIYSQKDSLTAVSKLFTSDNDFVSSIAASVDPAKAIKEACQEDRTLLFDFIHDVYFGFIRKSIAENRLTFGLTAMFAYLVLYDDKSVREFNKIKYLTVDEFQDTNELQMRISLLLLSKDNLCVVGDWKQSIYKFRYAEEKNITEFDQRIQNLIDDLNYDEIRVPTLSQNIEHIDLNENYRSSETVLNTAFESLKIPGSDKEKKLDNGKIVYLESKRNEEIGEYTSFDLHCCDSREEEIRSVVSKIIEYKTNPKYKIVENGVPRPIKFKDIAVLVRGFYFANEILKECNNRNVPAFYQGDLEIMSSREGKLTLAWLRYINNPGDKRGLVTILADLGYSLDQIKFILSDRSANVPYDIKELFEKASKMKKRPNKMLTEIYGFYEDLDYDIIQSITNILSSAYSGTLVTISDLINIIEDDMESGTKFDIEQSPESEAVTIQTLHKSKGLEYPIVIIPNVDQSNLPSTKSDKSIIVFDEDCGIRLKKEYFSNTVDGKEQASVFDSWKWATIKIGKPMEYNQERRLFFVGLSRAKQYLSLFAYKPSKFFKHYTDEVKLPLADKIRFHEKYENESESDIQKKPEIGNYARRKKSISVHDVMNTFANIPENSVTCPDDNRKGKGKEYGEKVHKQAYLIGRGFKPTEEFEDLANVKAVLDNLKGSKLDLEHKCVYPITEDTIIKGVIDVLAEFPDRIEIHDYKTDTNDQYLGEYKLQLSIYAHCVEEAMNDGRKVLCFIDFVSPDYYRPEKRFLPVEIIPKDEIERLVRDKKL